MTDVTALASLAAMLLLSAAKACVVLLSAAFAVRCMRRASAAARHLLWLAALLIAGVLPLTSAVFPKVPLRVLPVSASPTVEGAAAAKPSSIAETTAPGLTRFDRNTSSDVASLSLPAKSKRAAVTADVGKPVSSSSITAQQTKLNWNVWLLAIWLCGTLLVAAYWLAGVFAIVWLQRKTPTSTAPQLANAIKECSADINLRRPLILRVGTPIQMPMVAGVFRPTLLLPPDALTWPADQLRAVLLHELSHIRRWDCASTRLAQLVCALYWFNPIAWFAAARLRAEQERACDDTVLRHGLPPSVYAEHLLTVARRINAEHFVDYAALAMARRSGLRARIADILEDGLDRQFLSGRRLAISAVAAGAMLIVSSTLRLSAQTTEAAPTTQAVAADTPATAPTSGPHLCIKVLDRASGQPLAGAKIDYFNEFNLAKPFKARTDKDGVANVFLPSEARMVVVSPGHVSRQIDWSKLKQPAPADYTVKLDPGSTIGGKIVDDAGQPIGGAHVTVFASFKPVPEPHESNYFLRGQIVTDANGVWQTDDVATDLEGVSVGAYDYQHLDLPYYELKKFTDLAPLRDKSFTITLPRGVPLSGTIYGPDGKPIPGADVAFGDDQFPSNVVDYWHADANGHYAIAVKSGSKAVITASPHGFAPDIQQTVMGSAPVVFDFHLQKASTISGIIVNADGQPVPQAAIYFDTWRGLRSNPHTEHTDAAGHFAWHNAPPDQLFVDIAARGYARQNAVALSADTAAKITLEPQLKVTGTVVDAADGTPIKSFKVVVGIVFDNNPRVIWQRYWQASKSGDGAFEASPEGGYPGYALRIEADGYAPVESRVFKTSEHEVVLNMKLTKADSLVAHIQKPDGAAAAGARAVLVEPGQHFDVQNLDNEGSDLARSIADAGGVIKFPPLDTAFKVVVLDESGYSELSAEQMHVGGAVKLTAWSRVEGTLAIGSKPGAGQKVGITLVDQRFTQNAANIAYQLSATTDAQGQFSFTRVPAAKVNVSRIVEQPVGRGTEQMYAQTRTLTLTAGKTGKVLLGGTGRPVAGQLQIPDALKKDRDWFFEGAMATPKDRRAMNGQLPTFPAQISTDGVFHIDDVPAGTYQIEFRLNRSDGNQQGLPTVVGRGVAEFTVPEMAEYRSDETLELPPVAIQALIKAP